MTAGDGPRVGVVGDESLVTAVEKAGATTTTGEPNAVLATEPDLVVAGGEEHLTALVAAGVDQPVLAVDPEPGVPGLDPGNVEAAVAAVWEGTAVQSSRRVVDAAVDGETVATLLRDAMLVTGEPARISEYSVWSGDHRVSRFRADGVVVATPAGSPGYQGAAGGPVVEPGTGTLAVVPVAPFQTNSDHWVLDERAVSLRVERDEHVVLVADGRERTRVPPGTAVALRPAGELSLYGLAGDWKNSNGDGTE